MECGGGSAGCICFMLQQFCTCMVTQLKKQLKKGVILVEIGKIDFCLGKVIAFPSVGVIYREETDSGLVGR